MDLIPRLLCKKSNRTHRQDELTVPESYWSHAPREILSQLKTSPTGLTSTEAARRLEIYGPSRIGSNGTYAISVFELLWSQIRSPLVVILIFAAVVSGTLGSWTEAAIILTIVFASAGLGFWREFQSRSALEALRARIRLSSTAWRDGVHAQVPNENLVPGDVISLAAGNLVPADCVLIASQDLFVSQAIVTGESFPTEKRPSSNGLPSKTPLAERSNCVFLGTSIRSGIGRAVVVATGKATAYGDIAQSLTLRPPETEFDRGLRHFGGLLLWIMFVMVIIIFAASALKGRTSIDSMMFAVALAVGLSPELLPAILSINLASGASAMANNGVLVRHLSAIENLGSMDILCVDKTGTITEGVINLANAFGGDGEPSTDVINLAALNATFQTGLANALDEAILTRYAPDTTGITKLAEIPYDFVRKCLSVVIQSNAGTRLITKGAFDQVLGLCTHMGPDQILDDQARTRLRSRYEHWSEQGFRVLGVATKDVAPHETYSKQDETGLTFAGFLIFADQLKEGIEVVIDDLKRYGVRVKIITGDNAIVSRHIASRIGEPKPVLMTGEDLDDLTDEALWQRADAVDVFAQVDPNQKERIILALKKRGHVVGYMGDGINDAPAMHAADTSISVESAADVTKAAADFVFLEKELKVLHKGIEEGRRTFANTLKYILMTTSANLGNMISMGVASIFLPFLPMLAGQILLNNFLSDLPAIGLARDAVDQELVAKPRRWDIRAIRRFMISFGLISSFFDFLIFATLLWVFRVSPEEFRTGWFVESLLTELAVALILRTRKPFYKSRPGRLLLLSTVAVALLAFVIPYLPIAKALGFTPLPSAIMLAIVGVTAAYVLATEAAKAAFYRWSDRLPRTHRR